MVDEQENFSSGIAIGTEMHGPTGSGILDGVLVASKDINAEMLGVGGERFTEGALPILVRLNYRPKFDGVVIKLLREAGASIKDITAAPGAGFDTTYQPDRPLEERDLVNPHDSGVEIGGSSTGAAYEWGAVTRGERQNIENVPNAYIGTDFGGSVRQPAAFAGVVGIKSNITGTTVVDPDDGSLDFETISAYGDLATVCDILGALDSGITYGRFVDNPSMMGKLKVGIVRGNLVSNEAGPNEAAALANQIAYERTKKLLEKAGHEVVEIAPPLELSIRRRLFAYGQHKLGLTSKPYPYMLSRKKVKQLRVAYMQKASILSKEVLDDIEKIARQETGDPDYIVTPEDVTERVFAGAQMGEALKSLEADIDMLISECRGEVEKWFDTQGINFLIKQGVKDPNAAPQSILSDQDIKAAMIFGNDKVKYFTDKFPGVFEKFVSKMIAKTSMPELAWENILGLFSVNEPVTRQENQNGNWVPVSSSITGPANNATYMIGATAQLAQFGWNTPVDKQGQSITR